MDGQDNVERIAVSFLEELVMTPQYALLNLIRPGLTYLPEKMRSHDAEALLLAIGLQESRFAHRRQVSGPAHGFFQFERGGIRGVLMHRSSATLASEVLKNLEVLADQAYDAVVYNDTLAVVFARLLLWTDPSAMPKLDGIADVAWDCYIRNWRPGKPHKSTWHANYRAACLVVKENTGGD